MPGPKQPITLTAEQVEGLGLKLASLRHNINNQLSLIVAASELVRQKPDLAARFMDSFSTPPQKINDEIKSFSDELQRLLQITRP